MINYNNNDLIVYESKYKLKSILDPRKRSKIKDEIEEMK